VKNSKFSLKCRLVNYFIERYWFSVPENETFYRKSISIIIEKKMVDELKTPIRLFGFNRRV